MIEAQYWINQLDLQPHSEGGFYRHTFCAPLILPQTALPGFAGDRAASTGIRTRRQLRTNPKAKTPHRQEKDYRQRWSPR